MLATHVPQECKEVDVVEILLHALEGGGEEVCAVHPPIPPRRRGLNPEP